MGPYEITGTLGEGGMGVVYAARDARLDRPVALKMLRLADSDPAAGERLRREARAAALVNHPNVCQLYDIGEQDGRLFIAMEYLEGESLAARLGRGPIPPAEAARIALAIRRARLSTSVNPLSRISGPQALVCGLLLAYTNNKLLYTPTMPSKPVQISLDIALLERIDADEETRLHGRSAFMRSAAERYLRARQRARIEARIRAAYAGEADAMRREVDDLMDAQAWPED